jgi:hypothetical protein
MLAAVFLIFDAEVVKPGDMKILDKSMLVSRTFIRLFQE